MLPTDARPEGLLAIPARGLFVAATEDDSRGDGFCSTLSIFKRTRGEPDYPTIESANRADGTPILWSVLSGLAAGDNNDNAYTIQDSFLLKAVSSKWISHNTQPSSKMKSCCATI